MGQQFCYERGTMRNRRAYEKDIAENSKFFVEKKGWWVIYLDGKFVAMSESLRVVMKTVSKKDQPRINYWQHGMEDIVDTELSVCVYARTPEHLRNTDEQAYDQDVKNHPEFFAEKKGWWVIYLDGKFVSASQSLNVAYSVVNIADRARSWYIQHGMEGTTYYQR